MAATISLSVSGIAALYAKLGGDLIRTPLAQGLADLVAVGQRVARENAVTDTGALAASIVGTVSGLTGTVGSPLGYAQYVDQGRAAGARMPPPDALVPWLGRHGMDASLAFVVARAIGRRGISGRHFLASARAAMDTALPGILAQTAQRIVVRWKS